MLMLTRKNGESLIINNNIKVVVYTNNRNQIRVGIDAPKDIPVVREELTKKRLKLRG